MAASLAGRNKGAVSRNVILAQLGVAVIWDRSEIDLRLDVISFRLRIIRKEEVLYDIQNEGTYFNEASKKAIYELKSGDVIWISKVLAVMPGEQEATEMKPIILDIL
jgi:hypothetical protein